jgi:hypothetical protein
MDHSIILELGDCTCLCYPEAEAAYKSSLFYSFIISNEIWLKSRSVKMPYGSVTFICLYMGLKLPRDHVDPSIASLSIHKRRFMKPPEAVCLGLTQPQVNLSAA